MKHLSTYIWAFFFLAFSFFSAHTVFAQHIDKSNLSVKTQAVAASPTTVSNIGFVKIQNGHHEEAMFYYENNWKVLRDIALKKGYIQSYELLLVESDEENDDFDLMLVTTYKDEAQYEKSETNFQEIIDARTDGLKLLNDLQPGDFRKTIFNKKTRVAVKGK